MLGEALTAVNMEKNGILGCCMTFSLRGAVPALAVLLLAAGCIENVPRYIVIPAKGRKRPSHGDPYPAVEVCAHGMIRPPKKLSEIGTNVG